MSNLINVNAFTVVEGRPVTSSRIIANYFGKRHEDVVRSIRSIIAKKPELQASRNFAEWSEEVEIGSGAKRTVISFWMDRKGFSILAMGFTGAKALDFKCAFYDEFERMEKKLYQCPALNQLETLTPAQQHQIQTAVAARAQKTAHNYQTIYRALKNRYQVARYDQIPQSKFQDALKFIQCVDLAVPDSCSSRASTGQIFYYDARVLTEHELRALANLLYLRELGKPTFAQVYKGLRDLNSELAPRFYSLIAEGDFPAAALKNVLSRNQMDFTRPIR